MSINAYQILLCGAEIKIKKGSAQDMHYLLNFYFIVHLHLHIAVSRTSCVLETQLL